MAEQPTLDERIERLRTRGDAHDNFEWHRDETDYVAEFSLTADDIPALIALAKQWRAVDRDDDPHGDEDAFYGPVHAWRALGQLRAVAAVEPLLAMQDRLNVLHDDWYLEEFPFVFGLIGPPAIPLLGAYLADQSHREFPRACAADALYHIATRFPERRAEVIDLLTGALAVHQEDVGQLNGMLICNLLDLKAVEAAEAIERAFAADVVDPTIPGDWIDVRRELGVPGLGLAPDRSPTWPTLREQFGLVDYSRDTWRIDPPEGKTRSDAKREARAKKKAERKNRKKNRKSR